MVEKNPTGRGYDRYPSVDWTLVETGHRECWFQRSPSRLWPSLLMSRGPGQPWLDSGTHPAGWFPLPDAVVGAFWLPPICPSRSPSSMSLEQLWGLGRLLSELTQLCVTAACDRYTREGLCFAKCTTRFSVCDEGHHLLSCFVAQVRTPGSLQDLVLTTLGNLCTVDFCKHKTRVCDAPCATAVTCVSMERCDLVALSVRRAAALARWGRPLEHSRAAVNTLCMREVVDTMQITDCTLT